MKPIDDLHVIEARELLTPAELAAAVPIPEPAAETVRAGRDSVKRILSGEDERLLVVIGPCSIHDVEAAREFAERLAPLRREHADRLEIFMRVYFEKPRTTVGWKGLINDPHLDDSFAIHEGLQVARRLLVDLASLGMPCATEFLDPISPAYVAELVSWGAIGARTTESQTHRELASGVSCPVGFKNGTEGNLQIAVDAIRAAAHPHRFLGVTKEGRSAIIATRGNPDCHVILRGGARGPNYDEATVTEACTALEGAGLPPRVMIDCSHANSAKDPDRQSLVAAELAERVAAGDRRILGLMLEANLAAGRQDKVPGRPLEYGVSITDACMGWDAAAEVIAKLAG